MKGYTFPLKHNKQPYKGRLDNFYHFSVNISLRRINHIVRVCHRFKIFDDFFKKVCILRTWWKRAQTQITAGQSLSREDPIPALMVLGWDSWMPVVYSGKTSSAGIPFKKAHDWSPMESADVKGGTTQQSGWAGSAWRPHRSQKDHQAHGLAHDTGTCYPTKACALGRACRAHPPLLPHMATALTVSTMPLLKGWPRSHQNCTTLLLGRCVFSSSWCGSKGQSTELSWALPLMWLGAHRAEGLPAAAEACPQSVLLDAPSERRCRHSHSLPDISACAEAAIGLLLLGAVWFVSVI